MHYGLVSRFRYRYISVASNGFASYISLVYVKRCGVYQMTSYCGMQECNFFHASHYLDKPLCIEHKMNLQITNAFNRKQF